MRDRRIDNERIPYVDWNDIVPLKIAEGKYRAVVKRSTYRPSNNPQRPKHRTTCLSQNTDPLPQ